MVKFVTNSFISVYIYAHQSQLFLVIYNVTINQKYYLFCNRLVREIKNLNNFL